MTNKKFYTELFSILDLEQELLERVVGLSIEQQKALIHFNSDEIERVAAEQELYSRQMNECETQRLHLLSVTFGITIKEAREFKLSQLAERFDPEYADQLHAIRTTMNSLVAKIQFLNNVNRVLALRGRNSVRATLDHVRSQRMHVVNASL